MGSDSRRHERPRHRVFTDTFRIGATTVTRREYGRFLEATGHDEPRGWDERAFSAADLPVVGVSWLDAVAFCEWLSRSAGGSYRLPTEAEWEKAARGGAEGVTYSWGNDLPETIAYYQGDWTAPRPVGERPPNGYGLYNMGDNVHEWCQDWYAAGYYGKAPPDNPCGPSHGTRRVSRGGSWRHAVKVSRVAQRSSLPPSYRYTDYGFRIVWDAD